jgi:hypothetical protein
VLSFGDWRRKNLVIVRRERNGCVEPLPVSTGSQQRYEDDYECDE